MTNAVGMLSDQRRCSWGCPRALEGHKEEETAARVAMETENLGRETERDSQVLLTWARGLLPGKDPSGCLLPHQRKRSKPRPPHPPPARTCCVPSLQQLVSSCPRLLLPPLPLLPGLTPRQTLQQLPWDSSRPRGSAPLCTPVREGLHPWSGRELRSPGSALPGQEVCGHRAGAFVACTVGSVTLTGTHPVPFCPLDRDTLCIRSTSTQPPLPCPPRLLKGIEASLQAVSHPACVQEVATGRMMGGDRQGRCEGGARDMERPWLR